MALAGCKGKPAPVLPPPPPLVLTAALPEAIMTLPYSATLSVFGGALPLRWSIAAGSLPPGLSLDTGTGVIAGSPTRAGVFNFTVQATDSASPPQTGTQALSIAVRDAIPVVELISRSSGGTLANGDSGSPALSADGRYVVFTSVASDLILNDSNNHPDVFIRDRRNQTTARVSVPDPRQPGLPTEADGPSFAPAISADGRFVAYASSAANLVPEDLNSVQDVFVTELDLAGLAPNPVATRRLSVALNLPDQPAEAPFSPTTIGNSGLNMTADEHKDRLAVIVAGTGSGQVRWIRSNDATTLTLHEPWPTTPDSTSVFRVINDATRGVKLVITIADIFSSTTVGKAGLTMTVNEHKDRFISILAGTGKGQVRRITSNTATTLTVDPKWDTTPDATSVFRIFAEATGGSNLPSLSNDGQVVAFQSAATTLVSGDSTVNADIFVHSPANGDTRRVSVRSDGSEQAGENNTPFLSADGVLVAFQSLAPLAPEDTDLLRDVYVHDRASATTVRMNLAADGSPANSVSTSSSLSASGRFVLFHSLAGNLVAGDFNAAADLFVRDRETAETT
ncbi:MAG: putative Ig domain-containing protein, partial [Chloroflexota bacterium]